MQGYTNVKLFPLQRNCVYEFLQTYKRSMKLELLMNEESCVHLALILQKACHI